MADLNFQNLTNLAGSAESPLPEGPFLFSLVVVIVLLACLGNVTVILSIVRRPALRHSSNILLANMALSDLLSSLFGAPAFGLRLLWPDFWKLRETSCELCLFFFIACTSSSLTTLQCLSFNRYLMITKPRFVYERFFGRRKTLAMVVAVWVWSVTTIYLTLFVCGRVEYAQPLDGCYLEEGDLRSWVCLSAILVVSVIACIVIMPTSFFLTLHTIRKSRNRVCINLQGNNDNGPLSKEEAVITKMMIVILLLFIICWIPYSTVHSVNFRRFHSKRVNFVVAIFTLLNTAVNPFVYVWFNKPIRRSVSELFKFKF